jgi:hypothetical protein
MDFVSEVLIDREQRGVDAGFHQHVEKLIDWLIVLKLGEGWVWRVVILKEMGRVKVFGLV